MIKSSLLFMFSVSVIIVRRDAMDKSDLQDGDRTFSYFEAVAQTLHRHVYRLSNIILFYVFSVDSYI